jgi:hypothetical protein
MYDQRAALKAAGNPAQKALKLGLNSLYGKLAQSTGAREIEGIWRKPKWHNVLWAGWVTAYTRAQIFNAVRKHRNELLAIETDAVFMVKPIDDTLAIGDRLGEWERTKFEQVLYINSGVYYTLSAGIWRLKSRGIEADKSKSAEHWRDIFSRLPNSLIEITMRLRRFGTDIRQPERFARWFDHITSTTLPMAFSKRVHRSDVCITCKAFPTASYLDLFHYLVVPQPLIESDWLSSTPYGFPWRTDVKYRWESIIKSEGLENSEEIAWHE